MGTLSLSKVSVFFVAIICQISQGVCSGLSLSCCTGLVISHLISFRLWSLAMTPCQISSLYGLSFTPLSTNQIICPIDDMKISCFLRLLAPSCSLILLFFISLSGFQTKVSLFFRIDSYYLLVKLLMLSPFAIDHLQLIVPIESFGKGIDFVLDSLNFFCLSLAYQVTLWKVDFYQLGQHQ